MDSLIKKIGVLVVILALLSLSSIFVAVALSLGGGTAYVGNANVAVIPITGTITTASGDIWTGPLATSTTIRDWIIDADEDPQIELIVLEINSGGGSAVASDEIAQALKETDKPTVALIRELGASGAYWIASNTDHVIANRMSITGSVGVTASYIEFAGTLERYNATYRQFTSGERKELVSPWTHLTTEERAIFQEKINTIHGFFLAEVQANRNLSEQTMETVRTGEFFLGVEALELGLVDELGGFETLDAHIAAQLGEEPVYAYYQEQKTFFEELAGVTSIFRPPAVDAAPSIRA